MKKLFVILLAAGTISIGNGQQSNDGSTKIAGHQDKSFRLLGANSYEVTHYFESGKVKEVGFYLKGKKNGLWTSYSESGQVLASANFQKGKKDGKWVIWVPEEGIRYEIIYSKGRKITTYKFDQENKLLANK